ncbi:hypothetical protein [Alkalicoccobacillus gibsonii]|uniref:hypothetical protein n=1 Tax=Alkalicoccobacillus gibsonii TaxID=79881 RepID=UPI00193327C1|nr:hypothetical protein [Alkalicoccobacillus gibsonii]MBM0064770.1 hypothetical protein [Alkalicoccobacillus gibsonii]
MKEIFKILISLIFPLISIGLTVLTSIAIDGELSVYGIIGCWYITFAMFLYFGFSFLLKDESKDEQEA